MVLAGLAACGSARNFSDPNWLAVNGSAAFGSQCPYGSFVDPVAARVLAMDCNIPLKEAVLAKPLEPLTLSADCQKKILTVRTQQGRGIDSTWEVLPDNTFDFNVEGGFVTLADDGYGHKNCLMPVYVNIFGSLQCTDRDRVTIDFQSVWHTGKLDTATWEVVPYNKLKPDDGEVFCQVPPSCYLTAGTKLKQCS
ncbi:MAG TPA: hypothetical protein VM598_01735 [Bdellovibrionota bacterium]|nr:hypothetical protein [Bdellovibrionota bacterium]